MATYYKDCESLSIYTFHKILETGDYSLLLTEGTLDSEELTRVWEDIYSQYCKLSEDNSSLMYFATASELLYLETRYNIGRVVAKQLIECRDIPKVVEVCASTLSKWEYPINLANDLDEEIEKVVVRIKQSKNKIDRKKTELEGYGSEEEPMPLVQQAVKLARGLSKDKIDVKTTMVDEWIYLMKELKEINDARKKTNK